MPNITQEILKAKKTSYFQLSNRFNDIAPLRRVLSLMRSENKCNTIIIEQSDFNSDNQNSLCDNLVSEDRRCVSCKNYIEFINNHHTIFSIIKKQCAKIAFLSCELKQICDLNEDHCNSLLGYCIIHTDSLIDKIDKRNYIRSYLPECVLGKLTKKIRGFKYGNLSSRVNINSVDLFIKNGNYFSQQNGLTNCCSHAAIKTALRGYDENISCDLINDSINSSVIDSQIKSRNIIRSANGLTPKDMLLAISNISSNGKTKLPKLNPILATANSLSISRFLRTIYRAIESKIPVILLMRLPNDIENTYYSGGHAVSIIGHTLNEHNWCAYGSGYFASKDQETYLSSYLWCDNYVIQDDNFGPAYHLPCSFLADYYDYGVTIDKMSLNIASQRQPKNIASDYPLSAIIISPNKLSHLTERLDSVEDVAAMYLVEQIRLFGFNNDFSFFTEEQCELFSRYFYYIFEYHKEGRKPKVFITRTLLVSREEYLNSSVRGIYTSHKIKKNISIYSALKNDLLPEYFWLTEISVPELYWINFGKVGEIIIDATLDPDETNGELIKLIRLPYFLAIYENNTYIPIHLDKQSTPPYSQILRKKQGIIRQISEENI